jgi:hypothetical protein
LRHSLTKIERESADSLSCRLRNGVAGCDQQIASIGAQRALNTRTQLRLSVDELAKRAKLGREPQHAQGAASACDRHPGCAGSQRRHRSRSPFDWRTSRLSGLGWVLAFHAFDDANEVGHRRIVIAANHDHA